MSALPSWCPPEETKPAPLPLLLVQAFVNTLDVEKQTDLLADSDSARSWFAEAGLLAPGTAVSDGELRLAKRARESIRDLLAEHDGERARDLAPLREAAAGHHAVLEVEDGGDLTLRNSRRERVGDALFELLLVIRAAQESGAWARLKACANPDCRWAFYDRSRNQQGSWCEMAVCGNRLKNRDFRARRRG